MEVEPHVGNNPAIHFINVTYISEKVRIFLYLKHSIVSKAGREELQNSFKIIILKSPDDF